MMLHLFSVCVGQEHLAALNIHKMVSLRWDFITSEAALRRRGLITEIKVSREEVLKRGFLPEAELYDRLPTKAGLLVYELLKEAGLVQEFEQAYKSITKKDIELVEAIT